MPELPEVETICFQLNRVLRGLKITGVVVLSPKSFVGEIREIREIRGKRVIGVERRGKMIIIELEGGVCLTIHLKLTGQLIFREKGKKVKRIEKGEREKKEKGRLAGEELPNKYTRVIISFDNGGKLYFNDLRKFGWMKIVRDLREMREMGEMGVEPFDKEFTVEYLQKIFSRTSRPVKIVLMDQEKIAGIGNIYANEALWEAGISPAKPARRLGYNEITILREAILRVLRQGIKYGGASAADEAYVKPNGSPGEYQEHFLVYQREGQPCLRCKTLIKRVNLGGRGTFYCEKCQN